MTAIAAKSAVVTVALCARVCGCSQFSLYHTPAPARVITEERESFIYGRASVQEVTVKGSGAPIKRSIRCSYLHSYLSPGSTRVSRARARACANAEASEFSSECDTISAESKRSQRAYVYRMLKFFKITHGAPSSFSIELWTIKAKNRDNSRRVSSGTKS